MIRFCILTLLMLSTWATSTSAQDDKVPKLWAGIQANALTSFQVNSTEHEGSLSQGIVFTISDFEQYRFGIDLHLFRGFDPAIDFLYGGGIFFAIINNENLRLKSGLNVSKFAVNDYKREYDIVGGKIEDQFPETFKPYFELELPVAKSIILTAQGGYRLLRSDIGTVTKILEQYPNGEPSQIRVSENQKWYGSGFEFGLGFSVKLF